MDKTESEKGNYVKTLATERSFPALNEDHGSIPVRDNCGQIV